MGYKDSNYQTPHKLYSSQTYYIFHRGMYPMIKLYLFMWIVSTSINHFFMCWKQYKAHSKPKIFILDATFLIEERSKTF